MVLARSSFQMTGFGELYSYVYLIKLSGLAKLLCTAYITKSRFLTPSDWSERLPCVTTILILLLVHGRVTFELRHLRVASPRSRYTIR
jgi:hypothetical protein